MEKFGEELLEWERQIGEYERQSSKQYGEDNRMMRWAPDSIRRGLLTGDPRHRSSYMMLRTALQAMIKGQQHFDEQGRVINTSSANSFGQATQGGGDAMQVDALGKGGWKRWLAREATTARRARTSKA